MNPPILIGGRSVIHNNQPCLNYFMTNLKDSESTIATKVLTRYEMSDGYNIRGHALENGLYVDGIKILDTTLDADTLSVELDIGVIDTTIFMDAKNEVYESITLLNDYRFIYNYRIGMFYEEAEGCYCFDRNELVLNSKEKDNNRFVQYSDSVSSDSIVFIFTDHSNGLPLPYVGISNSLNKEISDENGTMKLLKQEVVNKKIWFAKFLYDSVKIDPVFYKYDTIHVEMDLFNGVYNRNFENEAWKVLKHGSILIDRRNGFRLEKK